MTWTFVGAVLFGGFLFVCACEKYRPPVVKPDPDDYTELWAALEKAQRTVDISLDLVNGKLRCAPGCSPFPWS